MAPKPEIAAPQLAPEISLSGDVAAILDIGRSVAAPVVVDRPDGSQSLVYGRDLTAQTIPALNLALPDRVTQREVLVEPASFVDYLIRFKSTTAICRASLSKNSIEAVLDYHGPSRTESGDGAVPQPLSHVAILECPFDIDYARWREVFGKLLKQGELVELLEDMIHTIGEPFAADLMDSINELKVDRSIKFKSGINQTNGTVRLTYEENDTDAGGVGQVTLPQELKLIVPVFQGGNPVEIVAKLRYRLDRGAIGFIIAVPGLDKLERDQFRSIGESVREKTSTPVYYAA